MKNSTRLSLSAIAVAMAFAGSTQIASAEDGIKVGGAVRVNYSYKEYSESSKDKLGDLDFDIFAIKFSGKKGDWGLKAEYRFTDNTNFIKYGYGYYDVNPEWQIQFGINQTPFGNRDYISNSFWFGMPYYVGLEDDHDMGIKATFDNGTWHTDLAFYKNSEYGATENKQYAPDLYTGSFTKDGVTTTYNNEETNQINLRQTYTMTHDGGSTTMGGSLQFGQIYNSVTKENGDRYAAAIHLDTKYNDWNLQLQALTYEFDTTDSDAAGNQNPNKIAVALLDWQYEIASKGQVYSLNLSKSFKASFGSYKIYNDFGVMTPDVADSTFDNSYQNVTGVSVSSGPIFAQFDFIMGKNMTFSTELDDHVGLPMAGDGWDQRVNINIGYYF